MSLSYGLNMTKKAPIGQRPPPAKRKTIFDHDSGPEDDPDDEEDQLESISTIGGLQKPAAKKPPSTTTTTSTKPPPPSSSSSSPSHLAKKTPQISHYGDLSTFHTTNKHAKAAQEIDPSIYDYDAAYDSLHAAATPATNSSSSDARADALKKPKYMSNLLAAADVRKRDALRAKEKMLAKEREAEGDEFKDKEAFVTGAYKRQQAEMRALEEEEKVREREAEERKRREGGGMKALYKNLLERDEERHRGVMRAVEEGRGRGEEKEGEKGREGDGGKKEKSEAEVAKEMGAQVNEDGQIVDKRQLLGAGLNAGAAPKARPAVDSRQRDSRGRKPESARERESRMFEEQLLGKRSASPDARDSRAAKSRKMEDELLVAMGSP